MASFIVSCHLSCNVTLAICQFVALHEVFIAFEELFFNLAQNTKVWQFSISDEVICVLVMTASLLSLKLTTLSTLDSLTICVYN